MDYYNKKLYLFIVNKVVSMDMPQSANETLLGNWRELLGSFERECKEDDCHKDNDGYWITNNKEIRTGGNPNNIPIHAKFLWRTEPNTGCYFSNERMKEVYDKSETFKSILRLSRLNVNIVRESFEPGYPNDDIWSLRLTDPIIIIELDNKRIYTGTSILKRGWKKHLSVFFDSLQLT